MTFKTLITFVFLILICLAVFLAGSLEYREFFAEPDIFVQQRSDKEDTILKISNKKAEPIFTAPKIQEFAVTKTQMLISTGELNKESELTLIDLKTKKAKKLDYFGKNISKITSSDNNFALITSKDDKKNLVLIQDETIKEFNPESLLTNDCCLLLNPSGSFLVFKGLAEKNYLVDLENLDKAIILNSKEKKQNPKYFINDKDLIYTAVKDEDDDYLEIFDVISSQSKLLPLNAKYTNDSGITNNLSKLFYIKFDSNNGLIFNDQNKDYRDPNFNFVSMQIHPNSKFVLLDKINKKDPQEQGFDIYNTRTGLITKSKIQSIKSIWAK